MDREVGVWGDDVGKSWEDCDCGCDCVDTLVEDTVGGPGVSVGRALSEGGAGCEGSVDGGAGELVAEDGGIEGVEAMRKRTK